MANTKKMTLKYWNSLERDTKIRAIKQVFPTMTMDYLADEKPKKDSPWWKIIFSNVKMPKDASDASVVIVNGFYIK